MLSLPRQLILSPLTVMVHSNPATSYQPSWTTSVPGSLLLLVFYSIYAWTASMALRGSGLYGNCCHLGWISYYIQETTSYQKAETVGCTELSKSHKESLAQTGVPSLCLEQNVPDFPPYSTERKDAATLGSLTHPQPYKKKPNLFK